MVAANRPIATCMASWVYCIGVNRRSLNWQTEFTRQSLIFAVQQTAVDQ